jgi:hypothetical protein
MVVIMKNAIFWDVTQCGSMLQLLVTPNVVPSSPILVTLMMEAILSSEKSVLARATWRNIPEDGIHHAKYISSYSKSTSIFRSKVKSNDKLMQYIYYFVLFRLSSTLETLSGTRDYLLNLPHGWHSIKYKAHGN